MLQARLAVYASKMLHSGWLRPYSEPLDLPGKACQGQTLLHISNTVNNVRKSFYNIWRCREYVKKFFIVALFH